MSKHVFITGGASGIGQELARRFVKSGAHVSLFDRQSSLTSLPELQALAGDPTRHIRAYLMDVADEDEVIRVFADASAFVPPDIVINCAGIASTIPFVDLPGEQFSRIITVNLLGSRNVAAAALRHLHPGGQLVLFSSMAGLVGCYGYSAYCAAKYGVIGLAEVLRIELKGKGIAVSVVCPPEVDTPMVQEERVHRSKVTETMKLLAGSLTVEDACRQIHAAILSRKFLIIPGKKARLLWTLTKLSPTFITRMITDFIAAKA